MDVLLQNGDLCPDRTGSPVMVSGARELMQRAVIRLAVRRGALPYAPQLGSRLHTLGGGCGSKEALDSRATALVREALAELLPVSVRGADCRWDAETARLFVRVSLEIEHERHTLEVTI